MFPKLPPRPRNNFSFIVAQDSHLDKQSRLCYAVGNLNNDLQGRVKFPTGGKSPRAFTR